MDSSVNSTNDLMQLLQEADIAILALEQSRQAVDAAKSTLEIAKSQFEDAKNALDGVIAKADDLGIARLKVRKLAEERAAALFASGLISEPVQRLRSVKPRGPKKSKSETQADPFDAPTEGSARDRVGEAQGFPLDA